MSDAEAQSHTKTQVNIGRMRTIAEAAGGQCKDWRRGGIYGKKSTWLMFPLKPAKVSWVRSVLLGYLLSTESQTLVFHHFICSWLLLSEMVVHKNNILKSDTSGHIIYALPEEKCSSFPDIHFP